MKRYSMHIIVVAFLLLLTGSGSQVSYAEEMAVMPKSVYSSRINNQNKIALTFDDGPHPVYTPIILDILASYNVRATFFMIGENVQRYPELVAEIQRAGHEIGNHTYLHANLKESTPQKIREEILEAENILWQIGEQKTKILRPPGGLYDEDVCQAARALDYDIILWTIDTLDWDHTPSIDIAHKVLSNVRSGDIILCHDFVGGAPSPTPEALRQFIPELLQRGYEFVSVSELIHSP